jgi:ribonuclease R
VLPSDEEIIAAIPRAPRSIDVRALRQVLGVDRAYRIDLKDQVRALALDGRIERLRGNRYCLPAGDQTETGTLIVSPRGFGFVSVEGEGADVYIHGRNMKGAMHRDRVRVAARTLEDGRREGSIVEVVDRGTRTLVGTLRRFRHTTYVTPQDPRLPEHVNIVTDPDAEFTARDGDTVAVEILEFPRRTDTAPTGQVVRVFGPHDGSAGQEVERLLYDQGLPLGFPSDAEEEAAALPETLDADEIGRRTDLREMRLFTVDPESARDFDDAVHTRPRDDGRGWVLTVAVADVSHYVRSGTALDDEAWTRSTSVYLPDRVIPMLPHRLSSNLCSLRPGEDRPALAVEMEVSPRGEIERYELFEAVIRSQVRLTYERVARMLGLRGPDDEPVVDEDGEVEAFRPELTALRECTRALRGRRRRRGYLDLDLPEGRVLLDAEGDIEDIVATERTEAHLMIEEAMLAANEAVADHFAQAGTPAVFRVHEKPPEDGLARYDAAALALRAPPIERRKLSSGRLTKYMRGLRSHPLRRLLHMLLLRSMARARYAPEPALHFGLGAERYLHFTSPIRRYPDLVVHRLVKAELRAGLAPTSKREALGRVAEHCSRRERLAVDAERAVLDLYKALYLSRHVGEAFDGMVIAVTQMGVFVELTGHYMEGMLHVESLPDDYYAPDPSQTALVGRRTGDRIGLGTRLRVRVESVSVRQRRVDLALVARIDEDGGEAEADDDAR